MTRRRGSSSGFVLAEALVALAIAALTIALLTSATWGLNAISERRAAAQATAAVDWLSARRALIGWASGVTARGKDDSQTNFIGTATTARMVVAPTSAAQALPYVGELRIEALGDDRFALMAARHAGLRDARVTTPDPQETRVLTATAPIRLLYLFNEGSGGRTSWRYETGSGDAGLPLAIGIEVGSQRMLTVPILPTMSAACLARLGQGGLTDEQCELR